MADSVRMMDTAAMTRGLSEFRRLDPEGRVLSERAATQAAVRRVEDQHKDVLASDRVADTRVTERDRHDRGRRRGRGSREEQAPADPQEAVPEQDEGHLLDLKA